MINTVIALFVEMELLNEEEAELLAKKIRQATLPQDFASSLRQVRQFLKDAKTGR